MKNSITETELTKQSTALRAKKLTGFDDISLYLLKKCVPYILKLCLQLVSASVREGNFPCIVKKLSS